MRVCTGVVNGIPLAGIELKEVIPARYGPSISLVVMTGRPGVNVSRDRGIRIVQKACIERTYDKTGMIVSRGLSRNCPPVSRPRRANR